MQSTDRRSLQARVLLPVLVTLGMLVALVSLPGLPAYAIATNLTYDTIPDFNKGTLFHTGLTEDTANGGDGNGEIRLLNVGINAATWIKNVSVTGLPARWGHAAAYYNGRIYVSGGNTSPLASTARTDVRFASVNSNHSLTAFAATTALPSARWLHSMVALNGYLYVIGGLDSAAIQQATVYKAAINSDGTLGAWTTTGALPVALSDFGAILVGSSIYVIGGDSGTGNNPIVNTVYKAAPDGSGNIASWTAESNFPNVISRHAVAVASGKAYVAGGADFSNSNFYPFAYYGTLNGSGDIAWTQTDSMPVNLVYAAGVAYANQLYIVGGAFNNGANLENNIRSNLINPTGSLVTNGWTSSPVLSSPRQRTAAVVDNFGWIYVIQGQSGNLGTGGTPLASIDYGPTATAGATSFAPDGNYVSPVIQLANSYPVLSMQFTKNVPAGTTMAYQYRVSNDPAFSSVPFSSPVNATGGSGTNTVVINQTGRYIQFRVSLTANAAKTVTPVLNKVVVTYDAPTPTPTHTPSQTNTPGPTPSPTPGTCKGKPSPVNLVSPSNKAALQVRAVPLGWSESICAEKYKVIVRVGSKTGTRVFKKVLTGSKSITTTTTPLAKGKTYYWKVKACRNKVGCKPSVVWSFKVSKNAHLTDDGTGIYDPNPDPSTDQ